MAGLTHEHPTEVVAEEGHVMLEGVDGAALTMTPEAAHETANKLHETAFRAARQRRGEDELRS